MKPMLAFFLLITLLLTGCARMDSDAPDHTAAPDESTAPSEIASEDHELHLVVNDGHVAEPWDWNWFYHLTARGTQTEPMSIHITHIYPEAGTYESTLRYDGSVYTLETEDGSYTYPHLIYSAQQMPPQSKVDYAEYFLLSEDPTMTAERYFDALLSSSTRAFDLPDTRIVYTDYHTFDRAETFGAAPEEIQRIVDSGLLHDSKFTQASFFRHSCLNEEASCLNRYDYSGRLLASVPLDGANRYHTVWELSDGGFLVVYIGAESGATRLVRYDAAGGAQWEYTFSQVGSPVLEVLELQGEIFTFGEVKEDPDSDSDLLLCRFSPEGTLLGEKLLGGSDFDALHWVEASGDLFWLHGSTQSGDGDLPLSPNGYGVDFTAAVTRELELASLRESDQDYRSVVGYHNGVPVTTKDHIFTVREGDRLPEGAGSCGIFDYGDGYVVVRCQRFDFWKLNHPAVSYCPSYSELIVTGYSADGTPLWQTTGDIFVR